MPTRCFPLSCAIGTRHIPQRKLLVFILFWIIFQTYFMRIAFHVSILYLFKSPSETYFTHPYDDCCDCPNSYIPYQDWNPVGENWKNWIFPLLLVAFFIGYFISQILCLIICKWGTKIWLTICFTLQCLFFMLIPPFTMWFGWVALFILRFFQGLCAGFVFFLSCRLTSNWIPSKDRGVTNIILFSASHLGVIAGSFVPVLINDLTESWSKMFYIIGGISLFWGLLLFILCHESFKTHPFILQQEYDYLNGEISVYEPPQLSIARVFRSKAVWALIFATIGHDFCFYLYAIHIFWFYYGVKFSFHDLSSAVSLSFTLLYVSCFVFAVLRICIDAWDWFKLSWRRKFFTTIGMLIPPLFMALGIRRDCRDPLQFIFFGLALFFMGAYYSGVPLNVFDIAPIHAQLVGTVLNIFGTLQAIFSVIIASVIVMNVGFEFKSYQYIFYTCLGISLVCWLVYMVLASGTRQHWDAIVVSKRKRKRMRDFDYS